MHPEIGILCVLGASNTLKDMQRMNMNISHFMYTAMEPLSCDKRIVTVCDGAS